MSAVLRQISHGLAELLAEAETLSTNGLGPRLVDLDRLTAQLDAVKTATLAAFDRREAHRADLGATAASWQRHHLRLDDRDARARARTARALRDLDATREALAAGDISLEHAHAITTGVPRVGIATLLAAELALLALAKQATPRDVRIAVGRLVQVVDPDEAADAREARQRASRYLRISEGFDGMWNIDGSLDPAAGGLVRAALSAFTGPISRRPLGADSVAVAAGGDESAGADPDPVLKDGRSKLQRQADALVELCERALAAGDAPLVGGISPHVTLVMDVDTLRAEASAADGATTPAGAMVDALAASLGPAALQRLCCAARLTPLVIDAAGVPLALGRTQRLVKSHQLKALWARDGGCIAAGCDNPRVQAHHIVPWSQGGTTDLGQLALLCSRHHHLVHDDGWSVEQDPGRPGRMRFRSRDGRRTVRAVHATDRNPGAKIPLNLELPLEDAA